MHKFVLKSHKTRDQYISLLTTHSHCYELLLFVGLLCNTYFSAKNRQIFEHFENFWFLQLFYIFLNKGKFTFYDSVVVVTETEFFLLSILNGFGDKTSSRENRKRLNDKYEKCEIFEILRNFVTWFQIFVQFTLSRTPRMSFYDMNFKFFLFLLR